MKAAGQFGAFGEDGNEKAEAGAVAPSAASSRMVKEPPRRDGARRRGAFSYPPGRHKILCRES